MEIVVLVDLQSIRLVIVLNSGVGLYNVAPLPAHVQVVYFSAFRHVLRAFPYLKHVGSVLERSAVLVCVQSHFQVQRHVTVREVEYLTRRSRSVFWRISRVVLTLPSPICAHILQYQHFIVHRQLHKPVCKTIILHFSNKLYVTQHKSGFTLTTVSCWK